MKDSELKKAASHALRHLMGLELLFVTGKGGVGKSSISAALALEAAAQKKRVLVVYPEGPRETNAAWNQQLTDTPVAVAEGIEAIRVRPEIAMREYVGDLVGSRKLASVLFHERVAQGLLLGIPGPSDWAILGKAWSLTKSGAAHRAKGERPYDLVIIDAPASGDGSGMLKIPGVIEEIAPGTQLRDDAQNCREMLQDPKRSAVILVTLAEHLSVTETEENVQLMRQELRMPLGPIFVNQVVSPQFSEADRQAILSLSGSQTDAPESLNSSTNRAARCLSPSHIQASREQLQEGYLERISSWQIPTIRLPRLSQEISNEKALKKLQMALAEAH